MNEFIEQFHVGTIGALWPGLLQLPIWVPFAVAYVVGGALILAWMAGMALIWTYGERRIAGFIQVRLGPNRVGPFGVLQPVADGIKLLAKEDTVPEVANWSLFSAAPVLVFLGAMIPFAVLPFSERLVLTNMQLALY
jgi:NADH-quinone oxidoreductase subunit H